MNNEKTQEILCCNECAHSHELAGYPSVWCEHLKRWTSKQARNCGGGARKPDRVTVDITAEGYTLTLHLNGGKYTEQWAYEGKRVNRVAGDIEDDNIVEDMQFPLLCLASESEHCMKQLDEIRKQHIIASSATRANAA